MLTEKTCSVVNVDNQFQARNTNILEFAEASPKIRHLSAVSVHTTATEQARGGCRRVTRNCILLRIFSLFVY